MKVDSIDVIRHAQPSISRASLDRRMPTSPYKYYTLLYYYKYFKCVTRIRSVGLKVQFVRCVHVIKNKKSFILSPRKFSPRAISAAAAEEGRRVIRTSTRQNRMKKCRSVSLRPVKK